MRPTAMGLRGERFGRYRLSDPPSMQESERNLLEHRIVQKDVEAAIEQATGKRKGLETTWSEKGSGKERILDVPPFEVNGKY